jgi:hypothetical protein
MDLEVQSYEDPYHIWFNPIDFGFEQRGSHAFGANWIKRKSHPNADS